MPPPRRHLLLQGKESDGDKFEKVLPRLTLPGKLRRNPEQLQIQDRRGFRENFRTGREHLGGLFHRNHQHEPGLPSQEFNPDPPDQLRWHGHHWTRMLHPDDGPRDLSGRIGDHWDPEEDHGLGRRNRGLVRQSQHRGHPQGDPGAPDQVQRRIRRQRAVQGTRPNQTGRSSLDVHLSCGHDRHRSGPLPDRHVDLEEMFQHHSSYGSKPSSTVGPTNAGSKPTSTTTRPTGDQQPGHQVKRVHPHSHQHLVKKLPEERERYWNNISSDIRRRNLIRRQAQNIFFCK